MVLYGFFLHKKGGTQESLGKTCVNDVFKICV